NATLNKNRPRKSGAAYSHYSEESERVGVVAGQHTLGLLVVLQRHLVGFPANPGFLVTTERGVGRISVVAVHPDPTGLVVAAHAVGQVGVSGPDTGAQTKLGVVGNRQRFFLGLVSGNAHHRANDFFLENPHLVVALEQGWLDVEAVVELTFQVLTITAGQYNRAFLATDFHVRHDLVELFPGRLGAYLDVGIQRVTTFNGLGTLNHLVHE